MSRSSPFVITLSDADRAELQRRARCYSAPHAEVVRAKIVLLAGGGLENMVIAARLDVHVGVVSRWRKRFAREGMSGLADRQRSGRPRVFPAAVVAEVKAMPCEPPEDRGVVSGGPGRAGGRRGPGGVGGAVDGAAVAGCRRDPPVAVPVVDLPAGPGFRGQAGRVLDLYQRIWEDRELPDDEYVISTDEKSQLQILSRCHPGLPPGPGRPGQVEFEYERHGTVAYMAAYDVHRARLLGRVEPTTGIAPFAALADQVMTAELLELPWISSAWYSRAWRLRGVTWFCRWVVV